LALGVVSLSLFSQNTKSQCFLKTTKQNKTEQKNRTENNKDNKDKDNKQEKVEFNQTKDE
jgi:hypothetical protein